MAPLRPFTGLVRKLVLGIDVGTTYSGISYAILDPGEVPKIQGLTRFPGQENAAGDSKIPSIMYYRQDGTVHSIGAESALPGVDLEAEDEDLIFVQWFKLHLQRPEGLDSDEINKRDLPSLPPGKTVVDVFADFLAYLFQCARRYIIETQANGESMWNSLKDRIEFVLSHPNGWEGLQQSRMRQAAVMAGLVPGDGMGYARIHFVTEGEASLHFCIQSGLTSETIKTGQSVMVVDAGGETVDISSYQFTAMTPLSAEEIASAECEWPDAIPNDFLSRDRSLAYTGILQGSTRINVRAEKYLRELLKDSAYGNDEDIKTMLDYFDKSTKPIFKDTNEQSYIKFGTAKCNDPQVKIRRGQLTLSGADLGSFFQPALNGIVNTVQRQRQAASRPISTVFLVGGFGASPWLYSRLHVALKNLGLTLSRPDAHTNKAVSEGAVAFYLEHFVAARVIRATYGLECSIRFDNQDPEHIARRAEKRFDLSGDAVLSHSFSTLLSKGTTVRENAEIQQSYSEVSNKAALLNSVAVDILCYKGKLSNPRWIDVESDTSKVAKQPKRGARGKWFIQYFNVIILCGSTELQAQISWIEDGKEKRCPATIVYDDELEEQSHA